MRLRDRVVLTGFSLGLFLSMLSTGLWAATVTRGKTFTATEQVTNTKLHQLVDNATVTGIVSADITDGTIVAADIANATITAAKITGGVILPAGAAFFMISGSCPTGTTDVTATYSNKFVRVNATGGTTGGADTHSHSAGTYAGPSHTHGVGTLVNATASPNNNGCAGGSGCPAADHTHTISGSTASGGTEAITGSSSTENNIPAFVTAKLCQVD
jgi:hypothetical protein